MEECMFIKGGTPKIKSFKCCFSHRKFEDAIDTNMIMINPSSLFNTDIDNIQLEFKKLLNNLKGKLTDLNSREKEEVGGMHYILSLQKVPL